MIPTSRSSWTSTVASALQCLEVFRLRTFDLMLIDPLLGGLGAVELVTRLRSPESDDGRPRSDIPIVVIAGSADEIELVAPIAHLVGDIVQAPIEVEDLALHLFAVVRAWREAHPDRPWADVAAQTTESPG
jgi:CheY-like chemotaxis protein